VGAFHLQEELRLRTRGQLEYIAIPRPLGDDAHADGANLLRRQLHATASISGHCETNVYLTERNISHRRGHCAVIGMGVVDVLAVPPALDSLLDCEVKLDVGKRVERNQRVELLRELCECCHPVLLVGEILGKFPDNFLGVLRPGEV